MSPTTSGPVTPSTVDSVDPAPKDGVERSRDAILGAADRLFYSRGIAAVTMAEIRDDAKVSLRRLYSMYPSKSDLVAAWLDFRHSRWMTLYTGLVDADIAAGSAPVDAVFAAIETWMLETDFRGCGFINTHAELSELSDEQRTIIRMHKRALADYLQRIAPIRDRVGGELHDLAPLVDGAIVQASMFADIAPIRAARRMAAHLEDHTP